MHHYARLSTRVAGIELRSPCLCGKYFTNQAVAPAHMTHFFSPASELSYAFPFLLPVVLCLEGGGRGHMYEA